MINDYINELFGQFTEARIDVHQIFAFSELDNEGLPIYLWAEDLDEPIPAGKIPIDVFNNLGLLASDPEAQHMLGLDRIAVYNQTSFDEEDEKGTLINFNGYKEKED